MLRFLIYGFWLYIQVRIYGPTIYSGRLPTGAEILGTIITFCVALVIDLMIQAKNKGLKLDEDDTKSKTPYLDSIQHDPNRPRNFPDYTQSELEQMFRKMCIDLNVKTKRGVVEKASATLENTKISMINANVEFENGRELRNLLEKAIKNQRSRIVRDNIDGDEADYLIPSDIPDIVQEENTRNRNRIGF